MLKEGFCIMLRSTFWGKPIIMRGHLALQFNSSVVMITQRTIGRHLFMTLLKSTMVILQRV